MSALLRLEQASEISPSRADQTLDAATLSQAAQIVEDVRRRGERAVRDHAERLGDLPQGATWAYSAADLEAALERIRPDERELLERTARRIERFALAQRESLHALEVELAGGGRMGHSVAPVERAGCYAPGGRYPLPSSVLMSAVTARVAGVARVWTASPRPADVTLAAAGAAGADGLFAVGGAQAIAAMAFGAGPMEPCDVICGPGNRWVTAAKKLVAGEVAIDMLAGPSELVVVADRDTDPALIAADLLAQAEHDVDARALLVCIEADPKRARLLVAHVENELQTQLADLPTRDVARKALERNGSAILCADEEQAVSVLDRLAPEHLELMNQRASEFAERCSHYGALFVGSRSAEVLGDYGAGPNHVLPTGGSARSRGGLSVLTFLRVRTWMRLSQDDSDELARDAAQLARLEGLEGHARSAERRLG